MKQQEQINQIQEPKILFKNNKNYVEVLINREKALNAMDHEMCSMINKEYQNWQNPSNNIKYVIFQGKGRAFCAGGDIKSSYQQYKKYEDNKLELYNVLDKSNMDEYQMYYNLAVMKNQISIMDGIIMGGGAGLGVFAQHKIATDKTMFAMPEAKIGFFCDVGCSRFYSQLRKNIGTYLGITGQRINGQEMVSLGLADYYIKSEKIPELLKELKDYLVTKEFKDIKNEEVKQIFLNYNEKLEENFEIKDEKDIAENFENVQTYEELISKLENSDSEFSKKTLQTLQEQCPLSIKTIFELIKRGKNYSIKQAFEIDFRLAHWFNREGEFFEGTRCVLVDKQDKPKYKYTETNQVTDEFIKSIFETGFEVEKEFSQRLQ